MFRASIIYENILQFSRVCLRSTLTGNFQSHENEKKCATRRLFVTHYLQVNQCEDNNTLQLNQPHKQFNMVPIYITAETQRPHKSDYGRRLIEVPSSLRLVCTVTDNYCRLNYTIYVIVTQDLCNCVIMRGGKCSKQSVILNYPLSSVATKHPVALDATFPTHCPRLLAGHCYTCISAPCPQTS